MREQLIESAEPTRPTSSTRAAWGWLLPVVLFLSTFGVFAATAERHGVDVDAYAASAEGWRMATAGKPWLDGIDVKTLQGVHAPIELGRWLSPAPNGHVVAKRMAGPVLAGLPFYWLMAHDPDPSAFSLAPGALAASFWTAGAVALMFLALRRRVSDGLAIAGALAFAFASPTWAVSANGIWTHTVTQPALAGAAYALSRDRWWLAGMFLGLGMLGRPHLALVAAVVGLGLAWSRRRYAPTVAIALPTVVSLAVLMVWNRWMFGIWSVGGAYDGAATGAVQGFDGGGVSAQVVNVLGFLVSPGRGLLVWTPVVLLFLPALVRSRRLLPDWSLWLLVGGLVYTFFQLRVNYFAGGIGFYSYRHGLELLTCLVPAMVYSVPKLGRTARWLVPPAIALQAAAIAIGAINEAYFIYIERMWSDNSFWVALRFQPGLVGTWVGLCLALGVLVSVMLNRGRPAPTN